MSRVKVSRKRRYPLVLEPIVNIPRRTTGKLGLRNPVELNGQINFFTTPAFKGTREYERNVEFVDEMTNPMSGKIILGSDWQLACSYGRGETKAEILKKKESLTPSAFAKNYGGVWTGCAEGSVVNISKLFDLRVVSSPELKGVKDGEYVISVDVARSQNTNNNQCSVAVLRIIRGNRQKIKQVRLVNMINIPAILNFKAQAQEIMRIKNRYDARAVVVDANGLGAGVVDELVNEQLDTNTGEFLGCYKTINVEMDSESDDAEEVLYALKSSGINSEIIINFIDYINSQKLALLERKPGLVYEVEENKYLEDEYLAHIQTDLLIDEIANLKLKQMTTGKYTVEQVTRKIDKDRWAALAYGLYYIKNYCDDESNFNDGRTAFDYFLVN